MFLIVGFFTQQILGVVGSQITKIIFSLARILTNLRKCRLQIENLEIDICQQKLT
jgi:uncharacterized membrane protein YeaQ/YmgE (transglycosylase-associated protein family)